MDVVFFSSKDKHEGNGRDLDKQYDRDQNGRGCNNTAMHDFISTKMLVLSWSKWALRLTKMDR